MNKDKLLKKLRKLKALAECKSGNVNETETAAALYVELLTQHGLSQSEVEWDEEEIQYEDFLPKGQTRLVLWRKVLLNFLAEACGCQLICSVPTKENRRERLAVVGAAEDVAAVRFLHGSLCLEILRNCKKWAEQFTEAGGPKDFLASLMWRKMFGQKPPTRSDRLDFCLGCADRVGRRAVASRKETIKRSQAEESNCAALVRMDTRADQISAKISSVFGEIHESRRKPETVNAEAYEAGLDAGGRIAINSAGALGAGVGATS